MANIIKTYTFVNGQPADATQVNQNFDDLLAGINAGVSATDKLLGRATAGAGPVEEIPLTPAGRALIDDASSAAQLVTLGAAPALVPINNQTGTTYTLVLADTGRFITFGNAAAIAVTIPTNAEVAFAIGTQIDCEQILAGKVTFGGNGVTINSIGGYKSIGAQWTGVALIKVATDTWNLLGDLIT